MGSFWPHEKTFLVGYLFGTNGVNGQLYRRLRDWLKWERKHSPRITVVDDVEEWRPHQVLGESSLEKQGREGRFIGEGAFNSITDAAWVRRLGESANPLNIAILKGRKVYGLRGRALRSYLREQGFLPPSAEAIRSRYAHLLRKLQKSRGLQ